MFGREFPLSDLLILWDAIFAFSSDLVLVNYILLSMLIAIREERKHFSSLIIFKKSVGADFYFFRGEAQIHKSIPQSNFLKVLETINFHFKEEIYGGAASFINFCVAPQCPSEGLNQRLYKNKIKIRSKDLFVFPLQF